MQSPDANSAPAWRWLPAIGSRSYYALLIAVAIFILGPLGGITAAYMNFSLGFFVGGQVLAGILGSAVTYGYGANGKHGANYMQTLAASVAGMSGMAVLVQAAVWLGLPEPPAWQLILYFMCIGMFGVGVGMLYTPLLVDKMRLTYPSGLAVANILRALTDLRLLRRSIAQLGFGTAGGMAVGLATPHMAMIDAIGLSSSTVGAGMVVAARIGIAAATVGVLGVLLTPYLVGIGWLEPGAPFRKIGFILALGTILGAAIVDIALVLFQAVKRLRNPQANEVVQVEAWKKQDLRKLFMWVAFWGTAVVIVATQVLNVPGLYAGAAVSLVILFVMINGISVGISDSNPISSAFVVTVFILAALGLKDPSVGLLAGSILLISTSVGCDMQQDRSTGWRLGSDRTMQFRFQVIGILMGAVLAVVLAKVFMAAYLVLRIDQYSNPHPVGAEGWGSAMTYKFAGALRGLTNPKSHISTALQIGIGIGLITEVLRKLVKRHGGYKAWIANSKAGYGFDFLLDSVLLPSPYASSFGGFVELPVALWFAAGGTLTSLVQTMDERRKRANPALIDPDIPEDMSTTSLVGGGLIAGDSLAALCLGVYGLLKTVLC